jgi:biotin carboxyl carrier protein
MKMENEVVSPYSGTVKKVHVAKGAVLEVGQVLVTVG